MKFAYLIMAHHRFDVLKLLLEDLDDERNDIFLHIDKKSKGFNETEISSLVTKSHLFIINRQNVSWGDYSQIQCVLSLIYTATKQGYHDYYHLLVGVEYPLKSQNEIHDFFERENGKEFVGYDNKPFSYYDHRIMYYYFGSKYFRPKNKIEEWILNTSNKIVKIQQRIGVNRIKSIAIEWKKGYANWSITHECALLVISQMKGKFFNFKYTLCADEIFLHTLLYNSNLKKNIYDYKDEYHSCMRYTTWNNQKNQIHIEDIPWLVASESLFARKIDSDDAIEIINRIKELRSVIASTD